MASQEKRGLVGISFIDNVFNMVEVEVSGGQYHINKIAKSPMNLPFDIRQHDNEDMIAGLSDLLNRAIESNNIMFERTAFSLDSQMVLVKKVPIDAGLSDIDIKEQVHWEVEQFIKEPRDHFIIDYSHLAHQSQNDSNELLVVAVRKAIIDLIVKIFSSTKLKLEFIDVNIFAAIRAIRANYEIQDNEKIALVDLANKGIILSLLQGGEFLLANEFIFFNEADNETNEFPTDEELAKLIAKELRRHVLDHKLGENIEDLDRVFLFGEMAN